MADRVDIYGLDSGLNLVLKLKSSMDEATLIDKGKKSGVKVYPLSFYYHDQKNYENNCVFLGYGDIEPSQIPEAIRRLGEAWFGRD